MTAPGAGSNGERVFIRLGPPPEEPHQFVVEGPEMMRGTPVSLGRRNLVHDVASLLDADTPFRRFWRSIQVSRRRR